MGGNMRYFFSSFRALVFFSILCGGIYPFIVTLIASLLFPFQSSGSLVYQSGKVIGSDLISQKVLDAKYFQPRPSAGDFSTVPSGASNLGPISAVLKEAVEKRRLEFGVGAPVELLTASGSGLDPHVSPEGALFQISRVARARGLVPAQVEELKGLVRKVTESPTLGFMGQYRVNVFRLNRSLEGMSK
jgi:K+-transporting ATPase ATPase C chain